MLWWLLLGGFESQKFRHFVHINIYTYFCLLMECFCMFRAPVQNNEGMVKAKKIKFIAKL